MLCLSNRILLLDGSAALASIAFFGAYVSRAGMTMKSVGSAALKKVEQVRWQFNMQFIGDTIGK